jgi:hypothetical protein
MVYLPGRRLRTAASVRSTNIAIGAAYAAIAVMVLQLVHGGARTMLFAAIVAVPFLYIASIKRTIARYNVSYKAAIAALHQGDAARADRDLRALEQRFRWPRFLVRLSGYNRSLALLRQGRHDDAIELLSDIDRRGGVINNDAAIAGTLAYVHALRGNVETAAAWAAEEATRRASLRAATGAFPDVMCEIALELRLGKFVAVQKRLADHWGEMEQTMNGQRLRPLRVFRAFAAAQLAQTDVREAGAVAPLLAGLHPARYEEFAYLGAAWPELEQFLRTNLPC